jgi:hypothetical protein
MVLAHLTIIVKLSKSKLHVLDMYLPVHEMVKASHCVGVPGPKVTLKALTAERNEVIYVQKRKRDDVRMLEQSETGERMEDFTERIQEIRILRLVLILSAY